MDGIVILNKPSGITSCKYLNEFKYRSGIKKCGYAGTLDPLASGVLLVGCNKGTKELSKIIDFNKQYTFNVIFGFETDSGDLDGVVVSSGGRIPNLDEIKECIRTNFIGSVLQSPPIFSAVKHNGRRLCDIARKGETDIKELNDISKQKEKLIHIYSMSVSTSDKDGEFRFKINCSKGTYIRQIAIDLAGYLKTKATATLIQRDAIGEFLLEDSVKVDEINKKNIQSIIARTKRVHE